MKNILALLDDINSIELTKEVISTIKNFIDSPLGAKSFIALCQHPQMDIASQTALELVSTLQNAGTMTEIVSWLVQGGKTATLKDRELWKTFVQRIEDKKSHYGIRAQALLGALFLSQTDKALLRRLQGILLDTDIHDDVRYLRHLSKIIGLILAHEIDEDLQDLLYRLSHIEGAKDEAWLEIGMNQLRLGLESTTYKDALTAFKNSLSSFKKSLNASEQRFDANLFYQCINMLIHFLEGSNRDSINNQIERIQKATFNYLAFITNSDRTTDTNSWIGLSNHERINWSLLALRLGKLDLTFTKKAWLQAAEIIEKGLLIIFTASRTLLKRNYEGGLESYLQPKLIGKLQEERIYLEYLEEWIEDNSDHLEANNAIRMRKAILKHKGNNLRHSFGEAAINSSVVTAILEKGQTSKEDQKIIKMESKKYFEIYRESFANPIVEEIELNIIGELMKNADYQRYNTARDFFNIFLSYTVRFLVSRMDDSQSTLPQMAYLFERNKEKLPTENDLQADYYNFLRASDLSNLVESEVRNIGSGRVDILFKFNGVKTVAELKQEKAQYSNQELIKMHGAQEVSYDATNVKFGILMVLDLFDRKGSQPHLTEQVSVHHIIPSWRDVEHSLVLFRVQGCRKTPSKIKL